jgi:hypothetical protein
MDVADEDIEASESLERVHGTWMEGLLVGLFLTAPTDRIPAGFPAFLMASIRSLGSARTLPVQLRRLGLDARDATEVAAIVGATASRDAGTTEIPVDELASLHARAWLDALIVARLIRKGDQDSQIAS